MVTAEQDFGVMEGGGFVVAQPAARRLGEYLRQLREERGLKIEFVARQLDWSTSYLQYVETKKRSLLEPDEVRLLATFYDVPVDDLMVKAGYIERPAGV